MSSPAERCRLYLVTPPRLEPRVFAEDLKQALKGGDVTSLQLRLKDATDDEIASAVEILMPIAQSAEVAFILGGRPDLATRLGCDGVHIGQDAAYAEARAAVGKDHIVGVTCHNSRHLAMMAAEAGADYVSFGPFFPSRNADAKTFADIEILKWWRELMVVPCVAFGGITVENVRPLVEAGADFVAVCSGVWDYPAGPEAAVKAFHALF